MSKLKSKLLWKIQDLVKTTQRNSIALPVTFKHVKKQYTELKEKNKQSELFISQIRVKWYS